MSAILKQVREKYEIVIIDSIDLKVSKEAMVLAHHTDATAVVVSEGVARRRVLKIVIQPFLDRKVNILGLILNKRTFPIPKFVYERI